MGLLTLLVIAAAVGGVVTLIGRTQNNSQRAQVEGANFEDALADARRWVERLGHQVLTISGTDTASTQAMADASERYNAANSALTQARTVKQAQLARESALEGLYYVNAAREILGLAPGPQLPELEAQRQAGRVSEPRSAEFDGETVQASPYASSATPHYYPGGAVAGRPVPAGWYSTAWWAPAAMTGVWAASSMMFYSTMFAGMATAASASSFEAGGLDGAGADGADMGDAGADAGDMGDVGGGAADGGGFFDGFGDFGGFGGDGGGFDFDF
ncbi:DUF1542 domain-containing protein [Corynebacterium appendicis]|uniref:DUF1542 domain-containing protein n=1 Tax=Corynebacterium appendicis TaxID=163202 RepID=UPI00254DEE85|nr:DUF1542 domain-containing protein [Corynebacterium appendicis]MDK8625557.1 DUF1542 domain-containing protein [Corynebacterium appendicis]